MIMDPLKKSVTDNHGNGDPDMERTRISLLNDEHWSYIRRQYSMSPRELQVARLVCEGFNNDEIADSLKITQGTIKTHIRNIYRRIRVKNKIEMLLKFVDHASKSPIRSKIDLPIRPGTPGDKSGTLPGVSRD
jgi:DNA-binding NarL/FixJ family response regulator